MTEGKELSNVQKSDNKNGMYLFILNLSIKFKSYVLFYNDHGIYNIYNLGFIWFSCEM